MSYFDKEENVFRYIEMAKGVDGRLLVYILGRYLPAGSSVLELGMGPGKDFDMLKEVYAAAGSDVSRVFLERYREKNSGADLLQIDAVTLQTDRKFDALYSNKVLIHLTKEELARSVARQAEVLNPRGVILHSFWQGGKAEVFDDLLFQYYQEEEVEKIFSPYFDILEISSCRETEDDDSLVLVAQKK